MTYHHKSAVGGDPSHEEGLDSLGFMFQGPNALLQLWLAGISSYQRMLKLQSDFVHLADHPAPHVRRPTAVPPPGPSFTDNYGKRVHDIDPEHDV